MDPTDVEANRELSRRIENFDVQWLSENYRKGEFAWAEPRLGSQVYTEIGHRIDRADLGWVATVFGTLRLPGFDTAGPMLEWGAQDDEAEEEEVVPVVVGGGRRASPAPARAPQQNSGGKRKLLFLLPVLVLGAVVAFFVTQCGGDDGPKVKPDLVATGEDNDDLKKWNEAVETAGLTAGLQAPGPFTVFAPTDNAFNRYDPETLRVLFADKAVLGRVVNYHVANGSLPRPQLKAGPLPTREGSPLTVAVAGGTTVDGANLGTERAASNGVLHTIDRLLSPPGIDLYLTGKGAIKALANESGTLTVSGTVGDDAAKNSVLKPLQDALGPRLIDSVTVTEGGPLNGLFVYLVGKTRENAANEMRAAAGTLTGIKVYDFLEVTPTPKLEADINALFQAEPIQFDSGSATIRAASNSTMDKAADLLKASPEGNVLFEGHTDAAGNPARNLALSQARAEAVKTALVERGVDAGRLDAKGYGSERPIADNTTAEGRQRNRRVEARVTF